MHIRRHNNIQPSHHAPRYVKLIVLVTVFSMAWGKIVMQRSLVVYHIPHVTCTRTRLDARVYYRENTSDSRDIPWYTTRKSRITSVNLTGRLTEWQAVSV